MRTGRAVCVCFLLILLLLSGCGCTVRPQAEPRADEIRAVWICSFELIFPTEDRTEPSFRAMAQRMIDNIRRCGLNTVFLQVRPFSDAIYRSEIFPYSAAVSGVEGEDPGYDALEIFCACAHKAGISLHAWINPFRIGATSGLGKKAQSNPAKQILLDNDPDNDSRIADVDGMLYYDPANPENQKLILSGVRELLEKYSINGIHIDDYFYPTTEDYIDQKEYDTYTFSGGSELRDDWRRAQINLLVSRLYTCVKSFGKDKIFSISPALNIENNRSKLYADTARWAAFDGYCDWLIPQVYVGYRHQTHPFDETVAQWQALDRNENVRLLFGLAAYKSGKEDPYAGSGRKEWVEDDGVLSRQIRDLREKKAGSGFALFSYSYIFEDNLSNNSPSEISSVISML